jgi:quinol monooxygenase YgiN
MRYLLCGAGVLLSLSLAGSPLALDAQADSTLYVVSYLEATAASQGQVAEMLHELAVASRKEGAVRYEALQRTRESNQFLLLEIWKDHATSRRALRSAVVSTARSASMTRR